MFSTINPVAVILMIVGIMLILLEFEIPAFGIVLGILGVISAITGVVMQSENFYEAFILFAIIFLIVIVVFLLFIKSALNGKISKSDIILKSEENKELGYTASRNSVDLVSKTGVALTNLHPSGAALVDGKRTDVVTNGDFILKGEKVIITNVLGRRIVVEKSKDEE